ncbi:MAG: polysaccharide biosynthesis protein [Bacilli bacterium]|nr:polysaccharide biosynthesis protein [Bacilli bacterium]
MSKRNVLFVASTGGHLKELMQLEKMFKKYDFNLITEKTGSNLYLKDKYKGKVNFLAYGTKDHMLVYPFKLLYNCFKSLYLYLKIHPDYIVTTGVHTAAALCCLGKIFGSKIIYIETFANISTKTVTGKYLYPISDLFIVQWESLLKLYPNAVYGGWIF